MYFSMTRIDVVEQLGECSAFADPGNCRRFPSPTISIAWLPVIGGHSTEGVTRRTQIDEIRSEEFRCARSWARRNHRAISNEYIGPTFINPSTAIQPRYSTSYGTGTMPLFSEKS
jgi:hypothetical protein